MHCSRPMSHFVFSFSCRNYVNQRNESFFTHDSIAEIIIGTRNFLLPSSHFLLPMTHFWCIICVGIFPSLLFLKNDCFDNEHVWETREREKKHHQRASKHIQTYSEHHCSKLTERLKYIFTRLAHNIIRNFDVRLRAFSVYSPRN